MRPKRKRVSSRPGAASRLHDACFISLLLFVVKATKHFSFPKETIMSEPLSRFDAWINEGGPSALVLKEYLQPAAGPTEVIFPPTFAPPEDKKGAPSSYIID